MASEDYIKAQKSAKAAYRKAVSQGEDEEFIEFLESFLDEEEPDKKPGDLN